MKIGIGSKFEGSLDFFMVPGRCPDCGEQRYIKLAFGSDGTMWIAPAEVGIGPQQAAQLEGFGEAYLLTNPGTGEVMINARAVVRVRTDPEWCRRWLEFVEKMLREHQAVRAQAAAAMKARNN